MRDTMPLSYQLHGKIPEDDQIYLSRHPMMLYELHGILHQNISTPREIACWIASLLISGSSYRAAPEVGMNATVVTLNSILHICHMQSPWPFECIESLSSFHAFSRVERTYHDAFILWKGANSGSERVAGPNVIVSLVTTLL